MASEAPWRFRAGAPNEDKFGFAQAVGSGGSIWVSGQVAKDNRSGAMHPGARSVATQVAPALDNVFEALERGGAGPRDLVQLSIHVAGPLGAALSPIAAALDRTGARPCLALVGVPALSHPDYRVEISATAETGLGEAGPMRTIPATGEPERGIGAPSVVAAGSRLYVSGCYGFGADRAAALGRALAEARRSLRRVDSDLTEVVAEHLYVLAPVDPEAFEGICATHRSTFRGSEPASTLVLVDQLGPAGATVLVTAVAARDEQPVPTQRR